MTHQFEHLLGAIVYDTPAGSPWLASFNAYLDRPSPVNLGLGALAVHKAIDGVAVYLGTSAVDRVVLSYGNGYHRSFSTKVNLAEHIVAANEIDLARAAADGKLPVASAEVAFYRETVEAERQRKQADHEALQAEAHQGIVRESEENVAGYFTVSQALSGTNVEDLITSAEVN